MKRYILVYRILREGGWNVYSDHHGLVCFAFSLEGEGEAKRERELGWERINFGISTKEGTYPRDYKPVVGRQDLDMLARKVSEKFPFEEGDEIATHEGGFLNVSQYPIGEA